MLNMEEQNHLGNADENDASCDICYDDECDSISLIRLKCCNYSKKICIKCINCLTTPICPYCRQALDASCIPYCNQDTIVSISEPLHYTDESYLSWGNFLSQESIIDPSLYDDSRRMRRMMRRLRYQYRQMTTYSESPNSSRRGVSRRERRAYANRNRNRRNNQVRLIVEQYNNHDDVGGDDELFVMDF